MSWMTLTLRKNELAEKHNSLEFEDLCLSRKQRKMARQYEAEESEVQSYYNNLISSIREDYNNDRDDLEERYTYSEEGIYTEDDEEYLSSTDYTTAANTLLEEYEELVNTLETQSENECSLIETEATSAEERIDTQKTFVESEMESVSEEADSVKEQMSSDIEETTINLA